MVEKPTGILKLKKTIQIYSRELKKQEIHTKQTKIITYTKTIITLYKAPILNTQLSKSAQNVQPIYHKQTFKITKSDDQKHAI